MKILFCWIFSFFAFDTVFLNVNALIENRCLTDIEIRKTPKILLQRRGSKETFQTIQKCTVIDGNFEINMILNKNYTDKDFPVFQNLREITGSLLIYNVPGLKNLNHIFPNLRIIGGQSLILNYALVIYQNEDLRFLGLEKLTIIRNGGVRITDNSKLCFATSINWESIVIGANASVKIERNGYDAMFSENGTVEICQDLYGCKVEDSKKCHKIDGKLSCWNSTSCQTYCQYHKLGNNKIGPGCSSLTGQKCHSSCLGGCELPNDPTSCYACRKHKFNGECLDECPPGTFVYLDNRCLTKSECQNIPPVRSIFNENKTSWKAFDGKCHFDCPDGYQEDSTNPQNCVICKNCARKCLGGEISSIKEALFYKKCNIIEGSLEINIEKTEQNSIEKLTKAFENIQEITGYLRIQFSPLFTSLHMFKNLEIIHGDELVNDRYALSVMELENLRQLFPKNITIKNGTVNFQNNPRLCYCKIKEFIDHVGITQNINDITKYSNGEKGYCNAIFLKVEAKYDHERFIEINFMKSEETNFNEISLIGATVFYQIVDKINNDMQIDDFDNDGSFDKKWTSKPLGDNIHYGMKEEYRAASTGNLEPNSIYAYFVQAKVIENSDVKIALSKIEFFQTEFKTPEKPILKKAQAIGSDKIVLEWNSPIKGNGNITHYTVMWTAKSVDQDINGQNDACEVTRKSYVSPLLYFTNLRFQSRKSDDSFLKDESRTIEEKPCQKCKTSTANTKNEQEHADESQFEDSVLDIIYPIPFGKAKPIEHFYFDQYNFDKNELLEQKKKDTVIFPEIANENITFGRANISSTRVILTGLEHFSDYYIQIIACQDVTVPKKYCSKQAASRIVRTKPIPENDVIDLNTIKVFPYIVNGTEQEDSRIISWKIPEDPNGAILGFRYSIWSGDTENLTEQCITKTDYEKINGFLIHGLNNGIYSFKIRSISSAGISKAILKKDFFEIHASNWFTVCNTVFYIVCTFVILAAFVTVIFCRYYNQFVETKTKKSAQKNFVAKGQSAAPLL